jgi:hypothetical protein
MSFWLRLTTVFARIVKMVTGGRGDVQLTRCARRASAARTAKTPALAVNSRLREGATYAPGLVAISYTAG